MEQSAVITAPDGALALITHLTEAINSDLDLPAVLQAVTDTGTRLSRAAFGAFFYNAFDENGDSYRLHVISGAMKQDFAAMPAPRITKLFEPTFTGVGLVRVGDLADDPRFAGLPRGHLPLRSYLSTPVVGRSGEVIGALLFGHPDPAVFDEVAETLVRAVASYAAVAVENARLLTDEQVARERAELVAHRLTVLQNLNERLARCLSVEEAMDSLVEMAARPFGVVALGLYLEQRGQVQSLVMGMGAARDRVSYSGRLPDAASPIRDALDSGAAVVISSRAELVERYPDFADGIPPVSAGMAIPMLISGETRGVLAVAWSEPREFDPQVVQLWRAVGDQLSPALERARLLEAEAVAQAELRRHVQELTWASQTLQRSLLPRDLPILEGLSVAVRYVPGMAGTEVGGDWYDMVVGPDGRVTLVVGDVEGHSISAAAVMGRVSTALNAYLREGHPAEVALKRVNPLVEESGLTVTCCLATLDIRTGALELVRAGHPQPVLWRGSASELETYGGLPLGVSPAASWPVSHFRLHRGDRLALYTDGLVERRFEHPELQGARLLAAVEECTTKDLETSTDCVLAAMDPSNDDVALLIAEYAGPVSHSRRMQVHEPSQVGQARRLTRDTLADADLTELADTATLVVSEMVTNALLHARSSATLELATEDGALRISVSDDQRRLPHTPDADLESLNGRGMLLMSTCAADWGVELHESGKTVWALVTA